jgi:hypothetical protein
MTIKQLKEELIVNNINTKACLIHSSFCPDGALCLTKNEMYIKLAEKKGRSLPEPIGKNITKKDVKK